MAEVKTKTEISCRECGTLISKESVTCPTCKIPVAEPEHSAAFKSDNKEQFELGIKMMKEYYDAIEGRMAATATLYVVTIGWLITSESARSGLGGHKALWILSVSTITLVFGMYCWNIGHWVNRWHQIRENVISLQHMPRRFYTRYETLSKRAWIPYVIPIAVLYLFIIILLVSIKVGWLPLSK